MARPILLVAAVTLWCLLALVWGGAAPESLGSPSPAWAAAASPHGVAEKKPPAPRESPPPRPFSSSPWQGLWCFLAGGFLSSLLWSALFGYPLYSFRPPEGFPLGLLDLTAAATTVYLGFLAVQSWREKRATVGRPTPRFSRPERNRVPLQVEKTAQAEVERLVAQDPAFSLESFGEMVLTLIHELHDAWNHQDLSRLKGRVSENLLGFLEMGLKILALRREISRLEDLSLKRLALVQAEAGNGRQTLTVWVEGQVLDYVLQSQTYKLLAGSMTYPAELRESWLFERDGPTSSWLLHDIQDF